MNTKKYIYLIIALATFGSLALAIPVFANTAPNNGNGRGMMNGGPRSGGGIVGTVASISGTTFTVTGKAKPNGETAITYTVDASSATVIKNGASSSISNIAVGDTIMVQGTVNGTNVVAKNIRNGESQQGLNIQGNGQPVVAGKVSAISGNTITITNQSNITYTIDASSAKFIVKGITNPTILNVATGDNIIVQGAVNGALVSATNVIDQKPKINIVNNSGNSQKSNSGFMGGVMNFFKHLFGF